MSDDEKQDWFVSNTPLQAELECEMFRFLQFHAGPGGHGLRLVGKSMPLVTGTVVHEALAKIVTQQILTPSEALDTVVTEAKLGYLKEVGAAGFAEVEGESMRLVEEQQALVEGLIRGWIRTAAPAFFQRFEILAVEQEMPIEVPWKHGGARLIRGCKPDLVVRDKQTKNVLVINWKTTSQERYLDGLANSPQIPLECVGAEQHLGVKVHGYIVYGLLKGSHKNSKLPTDKAREYTGPKQQQSDLCYAWVRQEIPGFQQFAIETGYYTVGKDGKNHKRGAEWKWAETWKHTSMREWVDYLPQAELNNIFVERGPYWLETYKVEQALRGVAGSELRWVERLNQAYEAERELRWDNPAFQAVLDGLFKRNYSLCRDMYYHDCPMLALCEKRLGWQQLVGYQSREAHYDYEKRIQEGE